MREVRSGTEVLCSLLWMIAGPRAMCVMIGLHMYVKTWLNCYQPWHPGVRKHVRHSMSCILHVVQTFLAGL